MRVVFIDLHCINFLTNTFSQLYVGNKIKTYKHKFLIDYALTHNITICNYLSFKQSTLRGLHNKLYKKICKIINSKKCYFYENNYVLNKNFGINNNIITITDKKQINNDDIVVAYLYDSIQLEIIKELPGRKICFMNHFISINNPIDLDSLDIRAVVNESDLTNNAFFDKYFKHDNVKCIVCPYAYGERFVNKHTDRMNKALAIGTLSTCKGHKDYKLYREFFKTEFIQNQRKLIFDNVDKIKNYIDSFISYILEDKIVINEKDNFVVKKIKEFKNKHTPWRQKKYTSFNMVDKFNEYMMFLCPEENAGVPGIGCFEGMACGTAYIGLNEDYYKKLGFIDKKNYISYDGSLDDMVSKIKYYMKNTDELKQIAKNGEIFVRENFNSEFVAENFFNNIEKI